MRENGSNFKGMNQGFKGYIASLKDRDDKYNMWSHPYRPKNRSAPSNANRQEYLSLACFSRLEKPFHLLTRVMRRVLGEEGRGVIIGDWAGEYCPTLIFGPASDQGLPYESVGDMHCPRRTTTDLKSVTSS